MKFSIHYTIKGPEREITVPNKQNPVEAENLTCCMRRVAEGLPESAFIEITGVHIKVEEEI